MEFSIEYDDVDGINAVAIVALAGLGQDMFVILEQELIASSVAVDGLAGKLKQH